MSISLLKQNKDTLERFKMFQNVIIHLTATSKHYGYVSGFGLNTLGEVVLEVTYAENFNNTPTTSKLHIHPLNNVSRVEIV